MESGDYMKFSKLTKRESEIMSILWNTDSEMSAIDIMNASDGISLNTIQQTLQKLLKLKLHSYFRCRHAQKIINAIIPTFG